MANNSQFFISLWTPNTNTAPDKQTNTNRLRKKKMFLNITKERQTEGKKPNRRTNKHTHTDWKKQKC
jgi:hypothetical protein